MNGIYSSKWTTPDIIISRVVRLFGIIDLDPCSDEDRTIPAKIHYTKGDDGLSKEWHGNIYMNPPYGREIGKWITHLCIQFNMGNTIEAIALVPARTDTKWWNQLSIHTVCFITGRITFSNKNHAPFPSAVIFITRDLKRIKLFANIFSEIGNIYIPF